MRHVADEDRQRSSGAEKIPRPLRAQTVWRRWKRASGFRHLGDQQRFWRTLDPGLSGFVAALFYSLFALPLELVLWGVEGDLRRLLLLVENTGAVLTVAFAGVWLASGVGLGRRLERRYPTIDRWTTLQKLRQFLLAGFPLLGFHVLALAQRRLGDRRRETGAEGRARPKAVLRLTGGAGARLAPPAGAVRVAGGWVLPWYLASGATLGWAVLWLAAQRGAGAPAAQLLVAGGLHGIAFWARRSGGVAPSPYSARQPWEARAHRAAAWLLLLPHPAPLLAILVSLSDPRVEKGRSRSVVRAAFRPGTEVRRLPRWRSLSGALRDDWEKAGWEQRWRQPAGEPTSRDAALSVLRLGTLYRLAVCLTLLDGMLLGQLFQRLLERRLVPAAVLQTAWSAVVWGGLGAALLGGLTYLGCLFAVVLRLRVRFQAQGLPLMARFLALTSGALVLGFAAGHYLAAGDLQMAGVWVTLPLALLLSLLALGLVLKPVFQELPRSERCRDPAARLAWILAPILLATAGTTMVTGGTLARAVAGGLLLASWLSPLAHFVMAFSYGRWLLRPYTFWDGTSGHLLPRHRRLGAFLAATLVLPLGGLAVPVWIWLGHRFLPSAINPRPSAPCLSEPGGSYDLQRLKNQTQKGEPHGKPLRTRPGKRPPRDDLSQVSWRPYGQRLSGQDQDL